MKKFITPLLAGKMPVFKDDLLQIQNESFTAFQETLKGLNQTPFVISGMVATNPSPGVVNITSGYVFIDGEIIDFSGYSGAYPVYINQTTETIGTKTYFDGTTQNVTAEKNLTTSLVDPGAERLVFNYDTTQRYLTIINQVALNAIGNKADATQEAEITITPNAPYTQGTSLPKYYKDNFGVVHLSGYIVVAGSTSLMFTLPINYRPQSNRAFPVCVETVVGGTYPADGLNVRIKIDVNGQVRLPEVTTITGTSVISLDSVSFRAV